MQDYFNVIKAISSVFLCNIFCHIILGICWKNFFCRMTNIILNMCHIQFWFTILISFFFYHALLLWLKFAWYHHTHFFLSFYEVSRGSICRATYPNYTVLALNILFLYDLWLMQTFIPIKGVCRHDICSCIQELWIQMNERNTRRINEN